MNIVNAQIIDLRILQVRQPVVNIPFVQRHIVKLQDALQRFRIHRFSFDVQAEPLLTVCFRQITFRQRGNIRYLCIMKAQFLQHRQILDALNGINGNFIQINIPDIF